MYRFVFLLATTRWELNIFACGRTDGPPAHLDSLSVWWFWMHHKWLRAVSASGLHQGAHVDITWTTTCGGCALVLPAFGAHRASLGGLAFCLRIPRRLGPACPSASVELALSAGHSSNVSVIVTAGRRGSLPLQDFARNMECLFNDKSSG